MGRKKSSVNGLRGSRRENQKISKVPKLRQDLNQASQSNNDRKSEKNFETSQDSEPTLAVQTPKRRKHVRFDEDSEWIDISGYEASNYSTEEGHGDIFTIDEDEYILL